MNKPKFDVLCLGLIVSDLLVRPVGKEIFEVDTTIINKMDILPGGDAMNQSIILSRLGVKTGLLGKTGDDALGRMVLDVADKNGVDITNVKIDPSTRTSTSIVLIGENGERNFVYCSGNNDALTLKDIDLSMITQTKIISVGSIFALPQLDKGGIEIIFKEASAKGIITAADATHDVYHLGLDGVRGILRYTDLFMPSYGEAVYLTKEKVPEKAADILLGCGVKTVVIKLGAKGCFIKNDKESHYIGTFDVPVVDTTGAGDNFAAGFLTGILKSWELQRCGLFANAVGAICVGEVGATASVKSMQQVLDFMESKKAIL